MMLSVAATRRSYPPRPRRHADVGPPTRIPRRGTGACHVGAMNDLDTMSDPLSGVPGVQLGGRARPQQRAGGRGADRRGDPHQRRRLRRRPLRRRVPRLHRHQPAAARPRAARAAGAAARHRLPARPGAARVRAGRDLRPVRAASPRVPRPPRRSCLPTDRISCGGWPSPSCSTAIPGTTTRSRSCSPRDTPRSTCARSRPWPATGRSTRSRTTPAAWPRWPGSTASRSPRAPRARPGWSSPPTCTGRARSTVPSCPCRRCRWTPARRAS